MISVSSLDNKSTDKLKKSDLSDRMATLMAKKAIEKIAGDLGLNIGRVSDDIKKYNFKINQFQNLNMGDELVKAVEQQANLAKNLPNYVKNNSELFKTAGIDIKTIKPVTPIKSSVINKIKTLIGNANIGGGGGGGGQTYSTAGAGSGTGTGTGTGTTESSTAVASEAFWKELEIA